MNLTKLPLILILLCQPSQDLSPLAVGPELDGDTAIPPMEQNVDAHAQQLNVQSQPGQRFLHAGKLKIELSLDGFEVKPLWRQFNASFSIIYQFWIGENGHPINIFSLAGEKYIDGEAASESLAKWVFVGLETWKRYVLVLNWEHMEGFSTMYLLSDEMSLFLRLPKDRPIP